MRQTDRLSAAVGAQVRGYMDGNKGLTEQTVLDRLDTFGRPMSRAKLGRIKVGKTSVSVDDLFGLAFAVGVAPASLLVDLTDDQPVEVAGEESMHPAALWSWISGLGADTDVRSYPFDGRLRAWQRRDWAWREFVELVGWQANTPQREQWSQDHPEWFEDETLQRWNGPPPDGKTWDNAKGEAKREAYGSARRLVSACFDARMQHLPPLRMGRGSFNTLAYYMGWDDDWKTNPDGWAADVGIEIVEDPPEQAGAQHE